MFTTIHQMRGTHGAAQNGSALILALLVLLVMSIVVMGMAADTDMDLKISRNLQLKNEAFNNAETGIDLATEALRHTVAACWDGDESEDVPEDSFDFPPKHRLSINSSFGDICDLELSSPPLELKAYFEYDDGETVVAEIDLQIFHSEDNNKGFNLDSTGIKENNASIKVSSVIQSEFAAHPAFSWSLFSHGDIDFNGNASIISDAHANQDADLQAEGNDLIIGDISAGGQATVKGNHTGSISSGVEEKDVPEVPIKHIDQDGFELPWSPEEIDKWRDQGKTVDVYDDGYDTKNDEEDDLIEDKIILVRGSAEIEGSVTYKNVTILATDTITFGGSSKTHDETSEGINKNAVISLGDIVFNGSTKDSEGAFGTYWCNGDFTHNGSATIKGSIVSRGNITFNGGSSFDSYDNFDNEHLEKVSTTSIKSWTKTIF